MKNLVCAYILFVAIPLSAFAAKRDVARISLATSMLVNSADLPAGDYRVTWDGPSTEVQVRFMRDGKVIATAPAKLVDAHNEATIGQLANPFQIETSRQGNSAILTEIRLPTVNLVFVDATTTGQ